ncbi:hypothetical protein MASR2M78_14480 [Treponema sp.]
MMLSKFHSLAEWKAALLSLPDVSFFDLMRGYLGDIKTPFNKQRLLEDLTAFLGRKEIQDAVAAYLDETDKKVIAAIGRLSDPSAPELTSFFDGDLPFADLHGILLNLEERLVVYRFEEAQLRRLALNPLFETFLAPITHDEAALFPSFPLEEELPPAHEVMDSSFLAAVISFLLRKSDILKNDGDIKKKAIDEIAQIFPYERFEHAFSALKALGAVRVTGSDIQINLDSLGSLADLSPRDRSIYLAAALCSSELGLSVLPAYAYDEAEAKTSSSRTARGRLGSWAELFFSFLAQLDTHKRYPSTTLVRILDAQERRLTHPKRRRWEEAPEDSGIQIRAGIDPVRFRRAVLIALDRSGFFACHSDGTRSLVSYPELAGGPKLTMDASFSILMHPDVPLKDALNFARFLDVKEAGKLIRFELSRDSAVRGFDYGMDVQFISSLLEEYSQRTCAQNIRWSLNDWNARYSSVALHQGIVLVVSDERRYLIEAESVAALISRVLAPGVYLLNVNENSDAVQALEKAGVDIVAIPPGPSLQASLSFAGPAQFPALGDRDGGIESSGQEQDDEDRYELSAPASENSTLTKPLSIKKRLEELRSALVAKGLPKDQKDELTARISRRVVLNESQLVGAAVRYEKLEAKGLDYVGKVRVAEQAISSGSLVELFWSGPKGESERAIGAPVSLEKSSGQVELLVDTAPNGERIRLAVGKISLLRRIKRSMFGD